MKKYIYQFIIGIATVMFFSLGACEYGSDKTEKAKEEMEEAADAMGEAIQAEKDALEKDLTAMQTKIDNKIASLQKEVASASGDAKSNLEIQIQHWKNQRNELSANLDKLDEQMNDSWANFKAETRDALEEMKKKWNQAFSEESSET